MFSIENWRLILLRKFELKNSSNEIKLEWTLKGQKSSSNNVKIGTLIYCKVKWKTAGVTAVTSSSALSKYVMCIKWVLHKGWVRNPQPAVLEAN